MNNDPFEAFRAAIAHRYRIERELGRGGMATVYLAHELKHGRSVALKVLRQEIASVIGSERFLREIEVTAHLTHPNILPLYDSDEAAGRLFYVMPYVEDGTLKDRLAHPPIPSIAEALTVTRQVAAGLSYAHQAGVVHRDIKPANILLSSGHAFIADFGIARAVRQMLTEDQLTMPGLALGTPAYMAPEQVAGSSSVDGRADEYALACVLHEMLLGSTPSGNSGRISVRRALRSGRADIPPAVEEAVERALSLEATKRFSNVSDFAAALDLPFAVPKPTATPRTKRLRLAAIAALALGIGIAIWKWPRDGKRSGHSPVTADTTRYAILPMEYQSGISQLINEEQLLHDALARWSGLSVVDHFQVRDALDQHGPGPLTSEAAVDLARRVGAGRLVRGEVSKVGDSLRVHATLYDVPSGGKQLREGTIKLAPSLSGADSQFTVLSELLLFGRGGQGRDSVFRGTQSVPARQAYSQGEKDIYAWDLAAADSAFTAATVSDPRFAQAYLWLALVRSWSGAEPARWRYAAEQAATGRTRLSARDQAIATAILTQARGDLAAACPLWVGLTKREPNDFVVWYGSAICLTRDNAVLRDSRSPSGWRFRSSYHAALQAYERAFQLLPSIHRALSPRSFLSVQQLFKTSAIDLRGGRAVAPDTGWFAAHPTWEGDSLTFRPYPFSRLMEAWVQSSTAEEAARHQRQLFHGIATGWVAAFPQSPVALEALAVSLTMLGNPAALDTLRSARRLAVEPDEQLRLATEEVWLRVRFSIPSNPTGLGLARRLADSLLGGAPPPNGADSLLFSSLAALTGRANLAASLSRHSAFAEQWSVSPALSDAAPALLIFAAMGGPPESLKVLEPRVAAAIEGSVPLREQPGERSAWLARAATLAFPDFLLTAIHDLAESGDYLLDGLAGLQSGDTASVRRMLEDLRKTRQSIPPGDRALDALYPEACLLAELGDLRGAVAWISPTLGALPGVAPGALEDPIAAGALVRTMALRAELASRLGDKEAAAQWARMVVILWSDADAFLRPREERLKRLVE
ncbi:MAG TPA: protein kinase [Gemmatimonadales bacterium]